MFLRRFDAGRGLQFLALIETLPPLTVYPIGSGELEAAVALLRPFRDQTLTMADAVGLHLMDARRISSYWSTDFHMSLTGVPLVIHQR